MSLKCPVCESLDVSKKGFRKNRSGKKQKYQCYDCKQWFIKNDGFKRMRFKPEIISRAVHQHADGFSLSKIQNHLWQHDAVRVSRSTVAGWVKKYSVFFGSDTS